ncbi:type II toxin-antitoxin system PrlF family antitoxin [Azospirillum sp. SYSU D00513]|uniref:type II toxin-antitoxin system PrlF family antitoxin n=1 Tax=Azospirillum sp. SYSU D00513 TaxID=2812561 RepID=UPI001A97A558|nr:type II toxin-antitoxin system PrlF family antitoxin [Azospirillum sp. SYSU D00513]
MRTPAYKGSITTTGSSEAIRFDKGLFRQNPEFRQKASVEAHVIGPGTLLVHVVDEAPAEEIREDPVVTAFLAFLEQDAIAHPERITPLSASRIERAIELTRGVTVSDEDVIPDDVTL